MQRRNRFRWLTYAQASSIVRENVSITSQKSYWDWHDCARPSNIPKMPHRVYKEWTTWGEYVGSTNQFGLYEKGSYRPYWEGVRWAQRVCIENKLTRSLDWLHYYDAHEADIPKDIPKNAHYHYKGDWMGWATWLGIDIESKVLSERQEISVFGLCTQSWTPSNVLRIVVAKDGLEELKELVADQQLTCVKRYRYEVDLAPMMQSVLNDCGSYQSDGTYIIRDMNGLLFEFDNSLLRV